MSTGQRLPKKYNETHVGQSSYGKEEYANAFVGDPGSGRRAVVGEGIHYIL